MASNEASELIEAALTEALKTNEDYEEGDILVEWAVIGFAANAEKDKGNSYPIFYSNNDIPHYRARGLFLTGLMNVGVEDIG